MSVPDSEWPDYVTMSGNYEGEFVEVLDYQRAFDTVVEVIDTQTGSLLASSRLDQSLFRFIGDNEIVSNSEYEEDGSVRVRIWKLELQYKPLEH